MTYQPNNLELWERGPNYMGEDYRDYYVVVSQHRDSDVIDRSNYRRIKEELEGEEQWTRDEMIENGTWTEEMDVDYHEEPWVLDVHLGHWAVGWVEHMMVYKGAPDRILQKADEIAGKLADYPVFDEDDWSTLEHEEAERYYMQQQRHDILNQAVDALEAFLDKAEVPDNEQNDIQRQFDAWAENNVDEAAQKYTDDQGDIYLDGIFNIDEEVVARILAETFLEDELGWVGRKKLQEVEDTMRSSNVARKVLSAKDNGEDRGFSVGFDVSIDPEHLDELVEEMERGNEAAGEEYTRLLDEAERELSALFGFTAELKEFDSEYSAPGDFKEWVPDLQALADVIAQNDMSIADGRIGLENGLTAENFHAVRGHWGRGKSVDYYDWDDAFGIE